MPRLLRNFNKGCAYWSKLLKTIFSFAKMHGCKCCSLVRATMAAITINPEKTCWNPIVECNIYKKECWARNIVFAWCAEHYLLWKGSPGAANRSAKYLFNGRLANMNANVIINCDHHNRDPRQDGIVTYMYTNQDLI